MLLTNLTIAFEFDRTEGTCKLELAGAKFTPRMSGPREGRLRYISLVFKAMHFADVAPAPYFCTWSSHFVSFTNGLGISETSQSPSNQGKMANLPIDSILNHSCCYWTCATDVIDAEVFSCSMQQLSNKNMTSEK